MVRIINQEQARPQAAPQLTEKSKVLLQVVGLIIADRPAVIRELLEDYSITFKNEPTQRELIDTLLSAIGECNVEFNKELAGIILDCSLEQSYDSFDIKSLFNKNQGQGAEGAAAEGQAGGNGGGGGGLWAGIAKAVGSIGGAIGQGLKGKQARDQATANTLQGIYAYKAQTAAAEQSKGKSNALLYLGLFVVLGLALTAMIYHYRKQNQQPNPLSTTP